MKRYIIVAYEPDPSAWEPTPDSHEQERDGLRVRVAMPDAVASRKYFGVPVARHGVQPVWIEVANRSHQPRRLQCVALDPLYFSPLEAAAACHYSGLKRLLSYGLMAWIFLPFMLLLILKVITVGRANRRMDAYFRERAFRLRPVSPGETQSGFVYVPHTEGTKAVRVRLLGPDGAVDFEFSIPMKGLHTDHERRPGILPTGPDAEPDLEPAALRAFLESLPAATTNARNRKSGDPVNLVIVAEFSTVLSVFGARWDETEVINLRSCWRTAKAFLFGREYRYSPVSALFLFDRCQDFALQRVRDSINERLHLRLWRAPARFRGKPVWVGQVSRDIGVRFTWKTWNLMTHRIDPEVDEARDYVVEDLIHLGRVEVAAYLDGVGPCEPNAPRRNLPGDPYYTDGKRAGLLLSDAQVTPRFLAMFGEESHVTA